MGTYVLNFRLTGKFGASSEKSTLANNQWCYAIAYVAAQVIVIVIVEEWVVVDVAIILVSSAAVLVIPVMVEVAESEYKLALLLLSS